MVKIELNFFDEIPRGYLAFYKIPISEYQRLFDFLTFIKIGKKDNAFIGIKWLRKFL